MTIRTPGAPGRALIILRGGSGPASGNRRVLERFAAGLGERGVEVETASLAERGEEEILAGARGRPPDVIHALHAWNAGRAARRIAAALERPLVVTATGTDIDQDLHDPERRDEVIAVLRAAAAVTVATRDGERRLREDLGLGERVVHAPKGIRLPPALAAAEAAGAPVFLLVAGFRPVKNNLFAIEALSPLAREVPGLRLRLLGKVLDKEYHEFFRARRREFPFVEEGGVVPPERVPAELAAAAIALNVSHSENAAHAVLEAMALGQPVLASGIPGNRELIRFDPDRPERSTGILYRAAPTPDPRRRLHDADDFRRLARRLLADPALRAAIGRNARDHIVRAHPPEAEIDALLAAYRRALG